MNIRAQQSGRRASSTFAVLSATALVAGTLSSSFGATYTFIPGAAPATAGTTANWNVGANWVNTASPFASGVVPNNAVDIVGSSTSATAVIDSLVPTINDVRWANAAAGTSITPQGSTAVAYTGMATLNVVAGGTLNVMSTNGTANGNLQFGRAQPSTSFFNMSGGTVNTGSTVAITNDSAANLVIADLTSAAGPSTSTWTMSGGTMNVGNNLLVANQFNATGGQTNGTINQSAGIINVAGAVVLGAQGTGTYTMTGGQLNQNGINPDGSSLGRDAFFVGRNSNGTGNPGATGTFTQSGTAAVTIKNGLYIANNNNTTGTYTVAGGTLSINGEIKVGAAFNSANNAATGNVGRFNIVGSSTPTITANRLTADTANSTLGFTIGNTGSTTLLDIVAGNGFNGSANFSTATKLDIDPSGFTPNGTSFFQLIQAASFNAIPTIVADGDAFDGYKVGFIDDEGLRSLVVAPYAISTSIGVTSNNWSVPTNWAGSVPSSARDVALFGTSASVAAHQVNLDGDRTVGVVNFTDGGNSYTVSGSSTLTLDNGATDPARLEFIAGLHTIATPIKLNSNVNIIVSGGSAVLSGPLNANGKDISKGGGGLAQLRSFGSAGALNVNGGTLRISAQPTANSSASAGKITALNISVGEGNGILDLGNSALVIDYTGSVGSQLTTLRDHIKAGRVVNSSANGLVIGYGDNATRGIPLATVAGLTVDTSSIVVIQTLAGDATLDRTVNFDDLVPLAQNYNGTDKVWSEGDFTYDGIVNFDDLVPLAQNYNTSAPPELIASLGSTFAADWALARSLVPEPTTLLGLAGAAIGFARRRR